MSTFVTRYRLISEECGWSVLWQCGRLWIPVYGPAPEADTRYAFDRMCERGL